MQIMIDIETLSTEPDAAITSIGAVAFEFNKGIVSEFYSNIDIASAISTGGRVCGHTLKWLLKQSTEMINECVSGSKTTQQVIQELRDWIMSFDHHIVWANSPSFDLAIIKSTMTRVDIAHTWKYYHERDYRTVISLAEYLGFQPKYMPKNANHNALDDARNQAEELIKAHNFLWELKSKSDDRDLIYLAADLKCSNCATQIFDEPWHHSNSSNKHIHLCDTCNQQLIENKINLENLGI